MPARGLVHRGGVPGCSPDLDGAGPCGPLGRGALGQAGHVLTRSLMQGRVVAANLALESGGQVLEQVPAVGDVDSSGCAMAGALTIDLGPVAGDCLDPGVFLQLPHDAGFLAIG